MNTDNNQPTQRATMTDRTDHRAAAQGELADAREWGWQTEEPTPEVGELTCLAYAAVHALLAIHDALTAADRYAANEGRQREVGADPLDEDDHRDRLTADRQRIVRHGRGHWHTPATSGTWCDADCTEMSLQHWARVYGPLTFASDAAQEDSSTHYYPTNIDRAPDGTAWSWGVAECHCDRPWRHE